MSFETTHFLGLPQIMPSQAQKHVTHNEALRMLDALVHLAVKARDLAAPPPAPASGERHIVAAGASGAWSGRDGEIAAWLDGAWAFFAPQPGWRAWIEDEEKLVVFSDGGWTELTAAAEQAETFGINTEADTTNRLAVKSDAALFSHDDQTPGSGDMRVVLNKAAEENTASILFQNDAEGRAEFGLTGNDSFSIKVSADGETWKEVVEVTSDGEISLGDPVDLSQATPALSAAPAVSIGNNDTGRPTLGMQAATDGNAAGTRFDFFRARGTILSPAAVAENDTIGVLNSFGYDGTFYRQTGAIRFSADAAPTSGTACPTRISFIAGTTGATERMRITSAGIIQPGADNVQDLGSAARRWKDIHASNGTIQTSDAHAKTPLRSLQQAECAVARRLSEIIGIYCWLSSVESKGDAARLHIGVTAQDVLTIFETEGLDGFQYGVLCVDHWEAQPTVFSGNGIVDTPAEPAGRRYGVRYDQLLIWMAVGFEERLSTLESAAR